MSTAANLLRSTLRAPSLVNISNVGVAKKSAINNSKLSLPNLRPAIQEALAEKKEPGLAGGGSPQDPVVRLFRYVGT